MNRHATMFNQVCVSVAVRGLLSDHNAVPGFSSSRFGVAGFVRIQTASQKRLNSHESSYDQSRRSLQTWNYWV